METRSNLVGGVSVAAAIAVTMAIAFTVLAHAEDDKHESHGNAMKMTRLTQIKTQAEAETLKPGDSIAMVCSMCKIVTVHPVGNDKSHIEMMTIGNSHVCAACGGKVAVQGTGKGEGKAQQVKHVCAKCGEDAMFVVATKEDNQEKHNHIK